MAELNTVHSRDKIIMYILMSLLVTIWGFDYVVAKHALELLQPMTLLFIKYVLAFLPIFIIKLKTDRKGIVRKKDIPMFILCSVCGEILYFTCEYTAMDYMPVSLITIVLAFVPAVSIIIEKVIFKRKVTKPMAIGVVVCVFGVGLIIGVDMNSIFQGRWIGYLLAFGAVLSWNAYNFLTASLHENYTSITMTMTQLTCTLLLIAPSAIHNMPPAAAFEPEIIWGLLYLGFISAGYGFFVSVKSIHVIGPTASSMFSNFLPITSTFFGWAFLGEMITGVQILGGVIVVVSACVVIKEKGRMDDQG